MNFIQNSQALVQNIVNDFLEQNGLKYFTYGLYDKDRNQFNILTTHPEFYQSRLDLNFPIVGQIFDEGLYLWAESLPKQLEELAQAHQFKNPMNIIQDANSLTEVISFGAKIDNPNPTNFYMNNIEQLKHYIKFFKDNGERLIEHAKENMLPCLHDRKDLDNTFCNNSILQADVYQSDRLYLSSKNKFIEFTHREKEVLQYYLQGLTAKTIGQKIFLSCRTVETYLERIKIKLNIRVRQELFDLATREGWIQYYL